MLLIPSNATTFPLIRLLDNDMEDNTDGVGCEWDILGEIPRMCPCRACPM